MKNNFASDVKTWLKFADYDLKTACWEVKGKIYTSACYSCQQAAEKALKALILAKQGTVPKLHNLDRLITTLKTVQIDTTFIEEEARELDQYYITTRYPGQYGGPEGLYNEEDAKRAIIAAETILRFVKEQILK